MNGNDLFRLCTTTSQIAVPKFWLRPLYKGTMFSLVSSRLTIVSRQLTANITKCNLIWADWLTFLRMRQHSKSADTMVQVPSKSTGTSYWPGWIIKNWAKRPDECGLITTCISWLKFTSVSGPSEDESWLLNLSPRGLEGPWTGAEISWLRRDAPLRSSNMRSQSFSNCLVKGSVAALIWRAQANGSTVNTPYFIPG